MRSKICHLYNACRANRSTAEATRKAARKSILRLLKQKQKAGKMERANDIVVQEAKRRVLSAKRKEVAAVYSARFASKGEVARMWGGGSEAQHERREASVTNMAGGAQDASSRASPRAAASPRSPAAQFI